MPLAEFWVLGRFAAGVLAMLLILPLATFLAFPRTTMSRKFDDRETAHLNTWQVPLRKVHRVAESTIHYDMRSHTGREESSSSLPRGGGILHLGPDHAPFSISMFHQLRCLDIIGRELVDRLTADMRPAGDQAPSSLAHHCMNYLRQMILCRADTALESATNLNGPHVVTRAVTHTCNDWSAVYDAAEKNYADYTRTR